MCIMLSILLLFFFFNDTATTEIYTLSLHDALPISARRCRARRHVPPRHTGSARDPCGRGRSEEHTSELQSRLHLVCRLLLEKKKTHHHLGGALQGEARPHLVELVEHRPTAPHRDA